MKNMGSYRVLVKVPAERVDYDYDYDFDDPDDVIDFEAEVEVVAMEMMEPFYEHGIGCRQQHLRFESTEDEDLEKFTNETIQAVRYPDGTHRHRHDPVFWDPNSEEKYVYPEECELVDAKLCDFYSDFEEFELEHLNNEKSPETGEWGYWYNPQGYIDRCSLDWVSGLIRKETKQIGAFVDGEPPSANIVRVCDVDHQTMDREARKEMKEWWKWYRDVESGRVEDSPIFGVHYDLVQMGIRRITNEKEWEASRDQFPKDRSKWIEAEWEDKPIDFDTFMETKIDYFRWHTYAVVEKDGTWHAPGRMGWFAQGTETVDEGAEWRRNYMDRFLLNEDDDTVLVVMTCHI